MEHKDYGDYEGSATETTAENCELLHGLTVITGISGIKDMRNKFPKLRPSRVLDMGVHVFMTTGIIVHGGLYAHSDGVGNPPPEKNINNISENQEHIWEI